ncbi:MAG: DUF2249 domain-containing protein [Salinibacterium sp.]|nr:DUF2249 domain-containing protein [Salinibacterium sp.]
MAAEPIDLQSFAPAPAPAPATGSACACGHANESEVVLDVRQIPHAVRHAAIFGALGAIAPGFSIDLVADHNPLPLLEQLDQKNPGEFAVTYLDAGPELWKLHLVRQHASATA